MKSASEARSELVMDIISGNVSRKELSEKIAYLENRYGEEAFTAYSLSKKSRPWDEDYYKKMEKQAVAGAGSKDFILHLYEVREEVKKKKNSGNVKKIVIAVCMVVIIAAIIAIAVSR